MAKASIYLDTRHKNKDGLYSIKIRITHIKERKYYTTGYYAKDQEDLNDLFEKNVRGSKRIVRDQLDNILSKAQLILDELTEFSYKQFELKFLTKSIDGVFDAIQDYIDRLKKEKRESTASSYNDSLNSFKKFLKEDKRKSKLTFGDITSEWLQDYEDWMVKEDNSLSTVGIYLRNLRRCYNIAIKSGIPQEWYPFGRDSYIIPSSSNHKKALTFDQVNRIFNHSCIEGSTMQKGRDYWMFSYLSQGMNMADIANLKWKNLSGDELTFLRNKTKRTKKDKHKTIKVYLVPEALEIIERWGNKDKDPDSYIFPIYRAGMNEERKLRVKQQAIKNTNSWMKKIADILELEVKPTFQYARHSYSTIMRNTGASIEYISQALGHNDIKTTQNYLDSFEAEKVKEFNSRLLRPKLNVSHKAG